LATPVVLLMSTRWSSLCRSFVDAYSDTWSSFGDSYRRPLASLIDVFWRHLSTSFGVTYRRLWRLISLPGDSLVVLYTIYIIRHLKRSIRVVVFV